MDKTSEVPPCPWSADVSWLAQRVCVGSICKVAVFWQKKRSPRFLLFFFFFTEKQTQLFKYSFFCPLSSLLPTALVRALFAAGEARFVTTLMTTEKAARKNADI